MIKTIVNVEGMKCPRCEAHVNTAIEKAFSVKKVSSSHSENKTEIISKDALDNTKLTQIIEEAGYKVNGITEEEYKKTFSLFR